MCVTARTLEFQLIKLLVAVSPQRRPLMPDIDVQPVMDAATSLQKTLSQMRSENPDLLKIGVHVTETEEDEYKEPTSTSARLIITIKANNPIRASQIAKPFEDRLGCRCQSTGEAEVTCNCPVD